MFRHVHDWYLQMREAIEGQYPDLRPYNEKSPFPAMTINAGPRVSCKPHVDQANPAYGICAITALGNFNDDVGGHLVLDNLRLVVQFPAFATILMPSAGVEHHNIPVRVGEERYSLVQYGAAGLFRWWEHGFMTDDQYRQQHRISTERAELDAEHRVWEGQQRLSIWGSMTHERQVMPSTTTQERRDLLTVWGMDDLNNDAYEEYPVFDEVEVQDPPSDTSDDDDEERAINELS